MSLQIQVLIIIRKTIFLLLFCSCAKETPWRFDTILTGNNNSLSKLQYSLENEEMSLEFTSQNGVISSFLSLNKHHFRSSNNHPGKVEVIISSENQELREQIPLLEGKMRLRLSETINAYIVQCLQEGKEIDILVDGFKQKIEPAEFAKLYRNCLKNRFMPRRLSGFEPDEGGAEAAKLRKFGDGSGLKNGGCSTQEETDSSGGFGINQKLEE